MFSFSGTPDYPFLGFSPDGAELIAPVDEGAYRGGNRRYTVEGGEVSIQPLPAILGRDSGWSRQVLGKMGPVVNVGSVEDVVTGRVLLSLEAQPLQARLSDDGQYLFRLICQQGLVVERVSLADGAVTSLPLGPADSICVSDYGHPRFVVPLSASRTNDTVVAAAERRGFALANFADLSVTFSIPADAPSTSAERTPNVPAPSDALTLELGPSERALATVDASGTLRISSYPELAQSLPDIATAVTSAFPRAYVTARALAPVAWSPDERYLATADGTHATVVRRACDGSIAVTLPPPMPAVDRPDDDPNWQPAFLAFNRQGLALAVLRVNEKLRATVSYYQLSPSLPN